MEQENQPINIETTPVDATPTEPTPEKDSVDDLGDAVNWQREFAERARTASNEIREVLKKYEIDMVAEAKLLEITVTVPVSFKDLRKHSPAQPVSVAETQ